jgi:hypothetical protein
MSVNTAEGDILTVTALLAYLAAENIDLYVALTTTVPTKESTGTAWTAPTGGSRVLMVPEADGGEIHNTQTDFGTANANEAYVGINVYNLATGGDRIWHGALAATLTVTSGQPIIMLPGSFIYRPDSLT